MAVHRHLLASRTSVAASTRRVSTGLRVSSAMDDPSKMASIQRLQGQINGIDVANRSIHSGLAMLQTADKVLSEVHSILLRARELAVSWNSGLLELSDKEAILAEWEQLRDEVERMEQQTVHSGIVMLSGETVAIQTGANNGDTMDLVFDELFGGGAEHLVRPGTFFALPWLDADVEGFDQHIADVAVSRGRLGAYMTRLENKLDSNHVLQHEMLSATSIMADVDMARESAELAVARMREEGAFAMMRMSNLDRNRLLALFGNDHIR